MLGGTINLVDLRQTPPCSPAFFPLPLCNQRWLLVFDLSSFTLQPATSNTNNTTTVATHSVCLLLSCSLSTCTFLFYDQFFSGNTHARIVFLLCLCMGVFLVWSFIARIILSRQPQIARLTSENHCKKRALVRLFIRTIRIKYIALLACRLVWV